MNNEMLKKRIIEQIEESWDEKRIYEYVDNQKNMNGKVVLPTEDAAKFDLLSMNKGLFTRGEFIKTLGVIGQIREARLDAITGKVEKGSSK